MTYHNVRCFQAGTATHGPTVAPGPPRFHPTGGVCKPLSHIGPLFNIATHNGFVHLREDGRLWDGALHQPRLVRLVGRQLVGEAQHAVGAHVGAQAWRDRERKRVAERCSTALFQWQGRPRKIFAKQWANVRPLGEEGVQAGIAQPHPRTPSLLVKLYPT